MLRWSLNSLWLGRRPRQQLILLRWQLVSRRLPVLWLLGQSPLVGAGSDKWNVRLWWMLMPSSRRFHLGKSLHNKIWLIKINNSFLRIEATAAPQVPSGNELLMPNDPRDVLISGLSQGDCVQGSIGVTAIYTATATSSITCLSTETQTNTFTLSGCTPTGLSYCAITFMPPAVSLSSSTKRA